MRRALALALVLASAAHAQDAGQREVLEVLDGYVRTVDAGTVQVHGGAYLPSEALQSTARELASLRAENESLKAAPAQQSSTLTLVVALTVGVLLGGGAAALLLRK